MVGFFTRDHARIEAAQAALRRAEGEFAPRQLGVLQGLLNCIDGNYGRAMSAACRTGSG